VPVLLLLYIATKTGSILYSNGKELIRAVYLPAASIFILSLLAEHVFGTSRIVGYFVCSLFSAFAVVWLLVTVHRFVLIDERGTPRWGKRHWLYLWYSILLTVAWWFAASLIGLLLFFGVAFLSISDHWGEFVQSLRGLIEGSLYVYLLSLVCNLFPSLAIDRGVSLSDALKSLIGHRVEALCVCSLPLLLLPIYWVFEYAISNELTSSVISSAFTVLEMTILALALSFLFQATIRNGT
jgi:hypothetical protein